MSDAQEQTGVKVMVRERIVVECDSSMITVDPGVFDAAFLCDMIGQERYMDAYASGRLVLLHQEVKYE